MAFYRADSWVMCPPAGLGDHERVWLEAVGFSLSIADLAFERLRRLLDETGTEGNFVHGPQSIPLALLDAWAYVDSAHRLVDLIGRGMRKLGTRALADEGRKFVDANATLLELRNCVQHVAHDEFERSVASGIPVWGSISWVTLAPNGRAHLCNFLPHGGGTTVEEQVVNAAGLRFSARTDHIHLAAYGMRVSLSDSHRRMVDFYGLLDQEIASTFADHKREFPASLLVVTVGEPGESNDAQGSGSDGANGS